MSTAIFPLSMVALAVMLVLLHLRAWRETKQAGVDEVEYEFAHRQCRRRVLASSVVGLIGVAVLVGRWVDTPLTMLFFWSGVLLLVVWLLLLALADVLYTRLYYLKTRKKEFKEQAGLHAELRRLRHMEGNGDRVVVSHRKDDQTQSHGR